MTALPPVITELIARFEQSHQARTRMLDTARDIFTGKVNLIKGERYGKGNETESFAKKQRRHG